MAAISSRQKLLRQQPLGTFSPLHQIQSTQQNTPALHMPRGAPLVAGAMGCRGGANSNSALTVPATWGSPRSSRMCRGRHK